MLYATSRRNDAPEATPRAYDADRDGLVVGEGGGMLVLESLDHARARGARIHAELVGFATNSDGTLTKYAKNLMDLHAPAARASDVASHKLGEVHEKGAA